MGISTEMHMCLDVRGFLKNRAYPRDFERMFIRNDGTTMTASESRDFLYDCLSEGREVFPLCECDNFDWKHGCRGHQKDGEGNYIKPLFIPLKAAYFDAFASGDKTEEMREYGKRWNEETCFVGRHVVLSRGYGKKSRLYGEVVGFERREGMGFGAKDQAAIVECFGTLHVEIACIRIKTKNEVYTAD